ncbi:MAG: MFS transporter [Proteobacteria bacterium]|nr:MFS transporter [Pseudomonadota bacterium]
MNQFQLLRSRRLAPLFIVQFLGAFNDNVFRFALVIFITFSLAEQMGIDPGSLVVISGGIFILPFFLFSSLAGEIADKFEKSALIRRIKLTEILVMGLGALAFRIESAVALLFVLFLMGTQSAFFGPLKYGILPQHLDESELTGGNALIQMGTYAAILIGGITGGLLAAISDLGPNLVIACILFLAICGWLFALAIPQAKAADAHLRITWNLPKATVQLLRYVANDRKVLTLVLTISWFWFLGATFLSLIPTYAKELLGADEQGVTIMTAAFTIGIGVGSLLCERYSRGRIELGLVPIGCIGISLFAADFYLAGIPAQDPGQLSIVALLSYLPALRAFVDLALIGAFGAFFIVPLFAALQAHVEPAHRARVIAALNVSNAAFMVFSALFTLLLLHFQLAIPDIFGIVAILNLVAIWGANLALPEFANRARSLVLRRDNC